MNVNSLAASTALALALGFALSACAQSPQFGVDRWTEEALLHDGQKILVERSQSYGGRHEIGQPPPVKEHTIHFTLPGTDKRITWTSEFGEDLGRTNFVLGALHILKGTPYLVALPNLCLSYNKWGRPNPPYVFFKYEGTEWTRIPLNDLPAEFNSFNLVINNLGEAAILKKQAIVTSELVRELNGELRQPEFNRISREPIARGGSLTSCEVLIRYKCGWGSPSEIARRYFENSCK